VPTNEVDITVKEVKTLESPDQQKQKAGNDSPQFWAMTAFLDKVSQGGQITVEDYAEISRRVRIFLHQQGYLKPSHEDCANPENGLRQVRLHAASAMLSFISERYPDLRCNADATFRDPWKLLEETRLKVLEEDEQRRARPFQNPPDFDEEDDEVVETLFGPSM
jgi:hypothetical protein